MRQSSITTEVLAERIRRQVQAEGWPDGSFFGTEADLAEQFGVSHGVVREAVIRLKSLGIFESRRRKGLIVRRPDPLRLLAESLPMLADSEQDVGELAQLRYVIEVGAIELAVAHATEPQIKQLEALAAEFEAVVRAGCSDEQENELELAFHGLILEMTGSRLIAGMQGVLARFFSLASPGMTPRCREQREQTIWQHRALAAAIRDRDVERARTFVREHFKGTLGTQPSPPSATSRTGH